MMQDRREDRSWSVFKASWMPLRRLVGVLKRLENKLGHVRGALGRLQAVMEPMIAVPGWNIQGSPPLPPPGYLRPEPGPSGRG